MSEPMESIEPPAEPEILAEEILSEENAEPAAAPAAEAGLAAALARIEGSLGELRTRVEELGDRTARLEQAADAMAQQIGFLPPQVRRLDGKVDGLAASLSEPRLRLALLGFLGIYDLVEQMGRAAAQDEAGRLRVCEVLRTQLRQVMEANGLTEISADGAFDPLLHRALQSVPVDDPAGDGHIVAVVRPGFRSGHSVLRYAEVSVGRYVPPEGPPAANDAPETTDAGDLPA